MQRVVVQRTLRRSASHKIPASLSTFHPPAQIQTPAALRRASVSTTDRRTFTHSCRRSQASPAPTSAKTEALGNPLNLAKWASENAALLQPPINNYCVYDGDVTVMIVGGPNARTDYHVNDTPEWFYQHKGSMLLRTIQNDTDFKDIVIPEGSMFLLPAGVPHNPVRFKDTVGVVLEQKRPHNSLDRLRWHCQSCQALVHEAAFHMTDLGTQIKQAVQAFEKDEQARTCKTCGTTCAVKHENLVYPGE